MRSTVRRGFTLIEILVVVVILGILALTVIAQFTAVADANDAAVRAQLQIVRQQIELFRVENGTEPRLVAKQWDDLVHNNYLSKPPVNPLNGLSEVRGAAEPGAGWVWRPTGTGVKQIYATDETSTAEYPE